MITQINSSLHQVTSVNPMQHDDNLLLSNIAQKDLVGALPTETMISSLKVDHPDQPRLDVLPAQTDQEKLMKLLANQQGIYSVQQLALTAQRQELTSFKVLPESDRKTIQDLYYVTKIRQHIQWMKDVLIIASSKKHKEYVLSMWFFDVLAFCQYDFTRQIAHMVGNVLNKSVPPKSVIPGADYIYRLIELLTSQTYGPKYWYSSDEVLFNSVILILQPYTQQAKNTKDKAMIVFANLSVCNQNYSSIEDKHQSFKDFISQEVGITLDHAICSMNDKGTPKILSGSEDYQSIGDPIQSTTVNEVGFLPPEDWVYPIEHMQKGSYKYTPQNCIMGLYTSVIFPSMTNIIRSYKRVDDFSAGWWVTQFDTYPNETVKTGVNTTFKYGKNGDINYIGNNLFHLKKDAFAKDTVEYNTPLGRGLYWPTHTDPNFKKPRYEFNVNQGFNDLKRSVNAEFCAITGMADSIEVLYKVGLLNAAAFNKAAIVLENLYSPSKLTQTKHNGFYFDRNSPFKVDEALAKKLSDPNYKFIVWDQDEAGRLVAEGASQAVLDAANLALSGDPTNLELMLKKKIAFDLHCKNLPDYWQWKQTADFESSADVNQSLKIFRTGVLQFKRSMQKAYTYDSINATYLNLFAGLEDSNNRLQIQTDDYISTKLKIIKAVNDYIEVQYQKRFVEISQLFQQNLKVFLSSCDILKKEQKEQTELINSMNSYSKGIWNRQQKYLEDRNNGTFVSKYRLTDNFFTNDIKVNQLRELVIDNIGLSMGNQAAAHIIIDHIKNNLSIPSSSQLNQMVSELADVKIVAQMQKKIPNKTEFQQIISRNIPPVQNDQIQVIKPSKKVIDVFLQEQDDLQIIPTPVKKDKRKRTKSQKGNQKFEEKKNKKDDSDSDPDEPPQYKKNRKPNILNTPSIKSGSSSQFKQASHNSTQSLSDEMKFPSSLNENVLIQRPYHFLNDDHTTYSETGWKGKFASIPPKEFTNCFGEHFDQVLQKLGLPYPDNKVLQNNGKDPSTWLSKEMMQGLVSPTPMLAQTMAWGPLYYHKNVQNFREGALDAKRYKAHISKIVGKQVPNQPQKKKLDDSMVIQPQSKVQDKSKRPSNSKQKDKSQMKIGTDKGEVKKLQGTLNKILNKIK